MSSAVQLNNHELELIKQTAIAVLKEVNKPEYVGNAYLCEKFGLSMFSLKKSLGDFYKSGIDARYRLATVEAILLGEKIETRGRPRKVS